MTISEPCWIVSELEEITPCLLLPVKVRGWTDINRKLFVLYAVASKSKVESQVRTLCKCGDSKPYVRHRKSSLMMVACSQVLIPFMTWAALEGDRLWSLAMTSNAISRQQRMRTFMTLINHDTFSTIWTMATMS